MKIDLKHRNETKHLKKIICELILNKKKTDI
jgi:hypothetical protein